MVMAAAVKLLMRHRLEQGRIRLALIAFERAGANLFDEGPQNRVGLGEGLLRVYPVRHWA